MTIQTSRLGVIAIMCAAVCGATPAAAALPCLDVKHWYGHFLVYFNNKYNFGFTGKAEGMLTPMGKTGAPISQGLMLPVTFVVEEVLPSGVTITKKILPDSLTTEDPPTSKPGKVSFRGKVTGGASFEGHIEVDRGVVAVGGRLLDAGGVKTHPLRFGVRVSVPSFYHNKPQIDKRAAQAFVDKLKEDHFSILWTTDKRVRFCGNDALEAGSKKINGPGIATLKIDVAAYQGKVLEFSATKNSRIELWCRLKQALHQGFSINWYPDPATDPTAKARLKFAVK